LRIGDSVLRMGESRESRSRVLDRGIAGIRGCVLGELRLVCERPYEPEDHH